MTVVVTGASGFVGGRLVAQLQAAGVAVVAASRWASRPDLMAVTDYAMLADGRFAGATLVHLAQTADRAVVIKGGEAHTDAGLSLCRRLLAGPWAHVIFSSSAVVYGDDHQDPCQVGDPTPAADPYAALKLACEVAVTAAGGTVCRLANVYGPGMSAGTVLSDILIGVKGRGPISVRDATPVRDFVHINDVAAAFHAAINRRPGGILNIGSGRGVSIAELARAALRAAGRDDAMVIGGQAPGGRRSHLVLDIAETESRLGWRPQIGLDEGLRGLIRADDLQQGDRG